jgi:16S rRNA (guanine(1405)-N(7))-methyltransferase
MPDRGTVGEIEEIVANVQSSRKYRHVCTSTIRRLATIEWAKRPSVKAAAKATKSRLHQVYAAYETSIDYDRAWAALQEAYVEGSTDRIRRACELLLARHASTQERLPILDRFYARIFAWTGVPRSVLDLACGLNPLSLPWMGLDGTVRYCGYDIDCERTAFLDRYLTLAGIEGGVRCHDVISAPPAEPADLALLLKSSTCLERQEAGSTLYLLDHLRVRYVVVSFPVKSLGRREKGMVEHYEQTFAQMMSDRPWRVERLDFETELVFCVARQ